MPPYVFYAGCLVALAGAAQAQAQTLTIGMAGAITSMDPHFHNASPNNSIAMQLFDRLTERGADGKLLPGLAESWKPVGDTAWEFRLRPGVTWQDGQPLTGDDVVFSLTRARSVPNSPGGFGGFLRNVGRVTVTEPLILRIETREPAPGLPGELAQIAIVSRHVGEGATTADYNAGHAAIGTGAFRFKQFTPSDRVVLERNPAWWGNKPTWSEAQYRILPNAAGRTAALLSGDVDLIEMPAAADLPRLRQAPGITISSGPGLRVIYLAPSQATAAPGEEVRAVDGSVLRENPLTKRLVRQALSVAINREAIANRIMEGTAVPTAQILPTGTFSYDPETKVPAASPEQARALLTQAGYPQGFRLVLRVPSDRYPNAPAVAQAVAQMWTRAGVQTQVTAMPWSAYSAQRENFAMGILGLGNATFDATSMLVNGVGTVDAARGTGASNDTGYSNPELDKLVAQATTTFDDSSRERLLIQATRLAMEDAAILPLYHQSNSWAMRRGLSYMPRVDERTLAKDVQGVTP